MVTNVGGVHNGGGYVCVWEGEHGNPLPALSIFLSLELL